MPSFIGNCTNIFDDESGNCLFNIFDNVSEFGYYENKFRKNEKFIKTNKFITIVNDNDIVKANWECYKFITVYKKTIYVAYDPENDVHWFWA